ncbi:MULTISPECIES: DUF3169 family protein [Staphylococcus]|jgi:Co/Zn/Cd efflux system component|uniref:DUF3169 family protein n=1 Tax=Staphylococcus TaxID=1279 RepID=UPI00057C22C9|nr:DUF3169 family protein [Staphylococcus shinii]MBO3065057.1 DUF3169 family protein [Staphylococcus shinii]MDW8563503.1 DUF3169 family protein [Staphylococcus shinii]MDW8566743.1 DUF3169 family protein [Staphylococcus shinii]MDW8569655.1 DUF3169 family protein [Staphylococcus shinii]MDW8571763.1 DUF3169 family protein [Staphylococcus shinii]
MKVGRYLLLTLLGGIVGGVIGIFIGLYDSTRTFLNFELPSYNIAIITSIIASILNIILTIFLHKIHKDALKYKTKMKENLGGYQTDELEEKANLKFMRSSFIYYIQVLISLVTLLVIVSVDADSTVTFYAIIPYLITIFPSLMIGFFVREYDSRYPKQGEAQYTEKTLQIMDEGERHITLISMYKTYHVNLTLIIIGAIILGIFSMVSGINQFVGLVILIVLFIYNAFGYLLKVSKFYK